MDIKYPLLIDGGLSNQLEAQGCNLNHTLWSAHLIEQNPDAIIEAHLAYLQAGAKCIITSAYQASLPGLLKAGYSQSQAEQIIRKTVELAEAAIKRSKRSEKIYIAASIGPYGAYLADGSEYRGDYGISDQNLKSFHKGRIELLDQTNADFFAFETIPSLQETRVLTELLQHTKKSAWLTFTCKDESQLCDGSTIDDAIDIIKDHPKLFAVGINCTAPQNISALIKKIKTHCEKRVIVYPNSGDHYDIEIKRWHHASDPIPFRDMAQQWLELGVDIIGGCCQIGPQQINQLNDLIN